MHLLTGHTSQLHLPLAELFPFSDGSDREMEPGFLLPHTLLTAEQREINLPWGRGLRALSPSTAAGCRKGAAPGETTTWRWCVHQGPRFVL